MELQKRPKRTSAEYERIGEQIERDPLRHSTLYQILYLQHWQPTPDQKGN